MYLRTIGRRNKDGWEVRYVQLAHNEWDPVRKCAVARVVHNFGREDRLDREALAGLVRSLSRVLEPEQALIATAPEDLQFVRSVPLGGAWALDGLWRRLGIDAGSGGCWRSGGWIGGRSGCCLRWSPTGRWRRARSWRAVSGWRGMWRSRACGGRGRRYRVMDWLLEIEAQLAEQVYWATADLLNLEVDLLFFDTTSTYFERDEPDEETVDEDGVAHPALRTFGHSKDHREDLPQVVVGLAVTRTGIPIRCWCWPGNQAISR